MEIVDLMSSIGGAFIGYHAVRLLGLACFRIGAAVREWRLGRPANVALRLAKYAMKEVDSNNDWITKRHAEFEVRLQALEEAPHSAARIAILEEQVNDLINMQLGNVSPNYSLADASKRFLQKYDERKKKQDLPN